MLEIGNDNSIIVLWSKRKTYWVSMNYRVVLNYIMSWIMYVSLVGKGLWVSSLGIVIDIDKGYKSCVKELIDIPGVIIT